MGGDGGSMCWGRWRDGGGGGMGVGCKWNGGREWIVSARVVMTMRRKEGRGMDGNGRAVANVQGRANYDWTARDREMARIVHMDRVRAR